jgi:putative membrane protein
MAAFSNRSRATGADATSAGMLEAASTSATRPRSGWQLALMGVGLVLLAVLIHQTGPRQLLRHVQALGWWAPVILIPYAVASAVDTAGWRVTFAGRPPSFSLLYLARLVGEAVNSVTPTAYLGGEPIKAYLLARFGVPMGEAAASVILAKTALTIAQIAFVILGIAILLTEGSGGWSSVPGLLAVLGLGVLVAAALVRWQRHGLIASIVRVLRRLLPGAGFVDRLAQRAGDVDDRLRAFYGSRPRAAVASVVLHLLGWIAGAGEVFAIMLLIGHPVTWIQAIAIEALAQPARLLGVVVPGTIGVQEAGGMVVYRLIGLPPELGLTTMLLKRVREIGYSLVGLALLAVLRARPER